MSSNRIHWIIDNGHGGIVNGQYVTAPSKMHVFPDGFTIYEGVKNRMIAGVLSGLLQANEIPHTMLVPGNNDVSLITRRRSANALHLAHGKNTVLVSIHCNAGGGTGFEVFTTRGATKSDQIATEFFNCLHDEFPGVRMRADISDGDVDKEVNFSILKCWQPAVLTENLFMDNRHDAEILGTGDGIRRIAVAHYKAIKRIDEKFNHIDKIRV